ncbi:plasmid mobilization protein [Streptomyces hokutonensis]|uniref:DUF1778 domain-containing protein n=1 Tax=Streptomyces hokutonensis TaxID=1306990 RepID=A0ABW6MGV7_9ACTN
MSDEQERAAYYEAHKDDEGEWGEPEAPAQPRRRLASMISVRLAPEESQLVRDAAERAGVSVSAFIRSAALAAAAGAGAATLPPASVDSMSQHSFSTGAQMTLLAAPSGADLVALGANGVTGIAR